MIIDFHTHIFPTKIASATVEALAKVGGIRPYSDGTDEALLKHLSEGGVDLAVNLPVLTKPTQFDSILKFAIGINKKRKNEGYPILSFAGIHPDIEDYEEKLALVKENGIKGIKIHPDYQRTYFDDEKYVRILAEAKRLDLITVTHAGYDVGFPDEPIKCTPRRVMNLLDRIGGYDKLVLAHMGGNQLFSEVYDILAGENVYFDTAYVLQFFSPAEFVKMVEKHGEDKVLFATDTPWRDIAGDVRLFKSFSLGESEKKIFSENAKALLNLN